MEKYKQLIKEAQQPLSDNAYLEKCIQDIYLFKLHDICEIKDTTSACVAITPVLAKMLGFSNHRKIIGTKDEEMPCKTAALAELFYKQDREVEKIKETRYFLDIHEYNTGLAILQTKKQPVINPATNNTLGTFFECSNFTSDHTLRTILNIHGERFGEQSSINISNNSSGFRLTELESNVLFCICLGISNKKGIADFLTYVHKKDVDAETTINDAFRRLYRKLECKTPIQLIECAVANNLHQQIPAAFLRYGSFMLS